MSVFLHKLFTVIVGVVATAMVLVLMVEGQRVFPLPEATGLAKQYWAMAGAGDTPTAQVLQQAKFYLFMLGQQWLLWLVPLAGLALTVMFLRRAGDEELAAYLERLHAQERLISELKQAGENTDLYWSTAREGFDKLMESSPDLWLVVGRDGRISRGNRAALQFLQQEQLAGHELTAVLPWLQQSNLYSGLARGLKGESWREDVTVPRENPLHLQALVWPWGSELAILLRDVSAFFQDNATLQQAETTLRQVVENSATPLAVLERDGTYAYVSNNFGETLGIAAKAGEKHIDLLPNFPPQLGRHLQSLKPGESVGKEAEPVIINGHEEVFGWHLFAWVDTLNRPAGYVLSLQNVTELSRLRAQTAEAGERENVLAYSDALTGLPNRQLFNDRLNMALAVAHRQLGKIALMFLDLDGFKKVNDHFGHEAGDSLLKQVAARLQKQVRETDTVARLGGDEFTIILGIRDKSDAEQVANKLLKAIHTPFDLAGDAGVRPATVGTSIGIALFPQDGSQAADLIRKADAAMYEAKQAGKNTFRFATKEIKIDQ